MSEPISAVVVFGTRPEVLKMAPVLASLDADRRFRVVCVSTGQHRELAAPLLDHFGIRPDVDLELMTEDQDLNSLAARAILAADRTLEQVGADVVLVQGDTTSAFAAALAAFQRGCRVGHVEAGLRSFDRAHPFPEESNRRMISAVADYHFAPTAIAGANLRREGIPEQDVLVTGNTIVDALLGVLEDARQAPAPDWLPPGLGPDRPYVLVTLHRRESWQEGPGGAPAIEGVLEAVRAAASAHPELAFVLPVHPNPNVQRHVRAALGGALNIFLVEPIPYLSFVPLMSGALLILTDSGGIQEEAPSLGVPALVARETTERPEAVEAGLNRLIGRDHRGVLEALEATIAERLQAPARVHAENPHGDGRAAERIRDGLLHFLAGEPRPSDFPA